MALPTLGTLRTTALIQPLAGGGSLLRLELGDEQRTYPSSQKAQRATPRLAGRNVTSQAIEASTFHDWPLLAASRVASFASASCSGRIHRYRERRSNIRGGASTRSRTARRTSHSSSARAQIVGGRTHTRGHRSGSTASRHPARSSR